MAPLVVLAGPRGMSSSPRVPLFHRARHVLAHVVQVEHVRKRGRQHHRLLVRQRSELGGERVEVGLRLRLVELLGEIVHLLQRLEELRAGGLLDDAEEQRADQIVGLLQHLVVIEVGGLARPREVLRANHRVLDGLEPLSPAWAWRSESSDRARDPSRGLWSSAPGLPRVRATLVAVGRCAPTRKLATRSQGPWLFAGKKTRAFRLFLKAAEQKRIFLSKKTPQPNGLSPRAWFCARSRDIDAPELSAEVNSRPRARPPLAPPTRAGSPREKVPKKTFAPDRNETRARKPYARIG